ncbi:hypothetical protein D3C71_566290 [compost metagenome]
MRDVADVAADFLGHGTLLFGRGSDLGGHVGDVGHRFADAHQCLIRFQHPCHTFFSLTMPGFHGLHGSAGGLLQLGDQGVNLPGGFAGALRQLTDFVGDHRKTTAHLTGAGRFDGGVERQQVGLVGDTLDHVDHSADFVTVLGQLGHGLAGFTHDHRQALNRFAGFPGDVTTATGQAIGFLSGVSCALDVARHFLGGRGHLVDGGGDLFGFHTLAFQAGGAVVRQDVGLLGLIGQVFGGVLQTGQAGFQACFLAEDRHFQTRLGATAVGVHLRDQRVGRGLLGQSQQTLDAALLPAQAHQAQRHRKTGRQGETPLRGQGGTDHETQLADQNERQPVLQDRQPFIRGGNG